MARYRDEWRDEQYAHGRYSGSGQSDDRRRDERSDHGVYGYGAKDGPGYEREPPASGDDYYYDPDHLYRSPDRYNSGYGGHGYRGFGNGRARRLSPYPESWRGHHGKGPKGYRRSDDRIREDVCDGLTDDPYLDASDIEVAVKDGEVTLGGNVTDRYEKRHAEEVAERASGVRHVQNNLRIGER